MPQYAAMVLSFHMSHSDIAFVVKFKFNEGGSEIGGGAYPVNIQKLLVLVESVLHKRVTENTEA